MRLSISNIAWDVRDDAAVANLLRVHGVDAIDVAPTKYFPDPAQASDAQLAAVKAWWAERGVAIIGMQSLLFGTQGLNLFGPPAVQQAMLDRFEAVCRVGAGLGATRLVFGSPRNRDRAGLTDAQALDIAVSFFQRTGKLAGVHGVTVCLEPNPVRYGANFMTTTDEALQVVQAVAHPAIRLQFDTGTAAINGEQLEDVLARCAAWVGHVHLSEPDLLPLGDGGTDHARMNAALLQHLPGMARTVEMLATTAEPPLAAIDRALAAAVGYYRSRPQ